MTEPAPTLDRIISRPDIRLAVVVGAVAFSIRLLYLLSYSHTPYWDALNMDPGNHWELAKSMASGRGAGPYAYFRAPMYIWLLSGFVSVFGESLWPIRIFQALLGSICAGMTVTMGRYFLSRPAAVAAGAMMAVFWVPVYFDGELLIASLGTFLNLVALIVVINADRALTKNLPGAKLYWLGAGVLLGISTIARPNVLVFVVAVTIVLFLRAFFSMRLQAESDPEKPLLPKTYFLSAVLFILGVVVCIAPVTVRNLAVGRDFVLIASQGGINFWFGNHEGADGRTVVVPYARRDIPLSFIKSRRDHPWVNEDVWLSSAYGAEDSLRSRVRESEISDYWYAQAFDWIRENPGAAALLILKKTLYLFQRTEVSNNRDLDYHARAIPVLRGLSLIHFGLISPFILAGLVIAFMRLRTWLWPLVFFTSYAFSVVAFFVTTRYRVPLLPIGMCLAALSVEECIKRYRAGKGKKTGLSPFLPLAALIVVFALFVNVPWPRWNDRPLRSAMHYNLGLAFAQKSEWPIAESELRESLRIKEFYPEAHFWLGQVMVGAGRMDDAAKEFEACLGQAPSYAPAHYELFRLYSGLSQKPGDEHHKKSILHLEKAHRLAPQVFPAPALPEDKR